MLTEEDFPRPPQPKANNRLIGFFLLVLGLFLSYWQTWLPLQAARAHLNVINYSNTLQFVTTVITSGGIGLLILGNKIRIGQHPYNQQRNDSPWLFVIALLAAGIVVNQWTRATLANYGYPNP
jgi:vacuolar-type H+-ATPase subunit I/STV1